MILSIVTVIVGFIYVSAQLDTRFSQYSEAGLNIYGLGMIVLPMLALVFTQYFFEKILSTIRNRVGESCNFNRINFFKKRVES